MPNLLRRPLTLLLMFLALFIAFDGLGDRKLANPDEGRYSEIAREMAATGDFVTPRLNGLKYFEKPPMQYWATALAFRLFGESEWTARLYTALCGLGCVLLMALVGWRLYDEETGLIAALVLLSAPYFAALNEIVTLDMGLTFWMTLSLAGFLLAMNGPAAQARRWMLVAWAGAAGAVLSKGLIGIVFPAAGVGLYVLVQRDWALLKRLEWLRGAALFLLLAAPWFVAVSLANAEFARFFFIHEHFERFLTTTHRRTEPAWFFLPILFAGFLPWALALLPAAWGGWRRAPALTGDDHSFAPLTFILLFCAFILAFFSASGSKLPAYILPMFPVLALVIAVYVRQVAAPRLAWLILPVVPVALAGAWWAWHEPARRAREASTQVLYQSMSDWVVFAALAIAVAGLACFVLLRMGRKWPGVLVIALGTMVGVESIERGYEQISPLQSARALAASITGHLGDGTRLYAVKHYEQSLPFYLKRTVTLVEYVDEFELGQNAEPGLSVAKLAELPALWNAPGPAIAIIQPYRLEEMRALGLAFEIIHQDPRRLALKKIPTP
ncbi:MAG TPA: glycosyltransferase family 39 protein [Usitatibacteraceae bacterium]|nr:glycosyltransferase family 39 protein [Usitatibacteraceae bacterium]